MLGFGGGFGCFLDFVSFVLLLFVGRACLVSGGPWFHCCCMIGDSCEEREREARLVLFLDGAIDPFSLWFLCLELRWRCGGCLFLHHSYRNDFQVWPVL